MEAQAHIPNATGEGAHRRSKLRRCRNVLAEFLTWSSSEPGGTPLPVEEVNETGEESHTISLSLSVGRFGRSSEEKELTCYVVVVVSGRVRSGLSFRLASGSFLAALLS